MNTTAPRIVCLIPAYNEEKSIGATIEAVLNQTRQADKVVVIPNGCTDNTAEVARQFPVTVMELPKLTHRKSEALNRAWLNFAEYADIVISLDADTVLPSNALTDWEKEFLSDPLFGGSTSKFTMAQTGFLSRLQRAEYASSIQQALDRGWTNVLAGAGAAFSGSVLRIVAGREDRVGPWSYNSQVEDFELTYRIREMGYKTFVSTTVRAYTDSMDDIKSLWGQRMKWQVGTIEDLRSFGLNKLTWRDWLGQSLGFINCGLKLLWLTVIIGYAMLGTLTFMWLWLLLPLLVVSLEIKRAIRIPHRDKKDILLAASFLPNELFMWLRTGWFVKAWWDSFIGKRVDRWESQYKAEGVI